MSKKLTQEEVEKRFKNKGWKLVGQYIGKDIKVLAKCPYCKKEVLIIPDNIFSGNTQSCGCVRNKLISQNESKSIKEKSLGYLYQDIAKLYSKNNEKSVFEIYPYSKKKYLWICEKYEYQHEYSRSPNNMVGQKQGCPYCSGHQVLIGFNDLASQRPDLLLDWDYEKNEIKSDEITYGTNKKVWWKCCKCNNEWKTSGGERACKNTGCLNCHPVSYGVEKIKKILYDKNIEFEIEKRFETCKNKNQLPFDFYLPYYNLLIEYQGQQHYEKHYKWDKSSTLEQRQQHDLIKQEWTKNNGYDFLVISYWNQNKIKDILCKKLEV